MFAQSNSAARKPMLIGNSSKSMSSPPRIANSSTRLALGSGGWGSGPGEGFGGGVVMRGSPSLREGGGTQDPDARPEESARVFEHNWLGS